MTIASETARVRHDGNGSTYQFSTSFVFADNTHVRVIHTDDGGTDTEYTENTHYTLTGAGTGAAGTVTMILAPTDYTPQTDETITIIRDVPFTQSLDASTIDTIPAASLEDSLDLIWMALTQVKEQLSRGVWSSETGAGGEPDIEAWSPVFAVEASGATRILKVTDWIGGVGTKPDVDVYVGTGGFVTDIANGVDVRGPAGASGAGTGDLLAANNLSDVDSATTARTNLGLGTAATQSTATFLQVANNLSDVAVAATARTNLGLDTAAVLPSTTFAYRASNLSDLASASTARTNLGLGTVATLNVGTSANNVLQLNGSAQIPAVSGALLTNLPNSGQPVPTASNDYDVDTLLFLIIPSAGGTVSDGSTISGANLRLVLHDNTGNAVYDGSTALSGTWKNISGNSLTGGSDPDGGLFVRTA